MEKIMKDLWSGEMESKRDHLVSWRVFCIAKEVRGLDISNMEAKNLSLLAKWL